MPKNHSVGSRHFLGNARAEAVELRVVEGIVGQKLKELTFEYSNAVSDGVYLRKVLRNERIELGFLLLVKVELFNELR